MANEQFDGLLNARFPSSDEPVLRIVVGPDRHDRVVVPIDKLDDTEFRRNMVMLGIEQSIGLFHYNSAREEDRGKNSLIILQGGNARRGPSQDRRVRVELTSGGVLAIDIGLRRNDGSLAGIPFAPVEVERIQEEAAVAIRFALRVFKEIDPFGRYAILLSNARLENLGYHNLSYRTPPAGSSTQIRMPQSDQPYIAFALPERLSRSDATLADTIGRKIGSALERRVNVQDHGMR